MPDSLQEDILGGDSLFRGIFESNISGLVVGDLNSGRIVAVNDRLLEITGASREELVGTPDAWREITPPEHHHLDERAMAQVLGHGAADPFEKEYLRPDGSRVPVRVSCAAVRGRPGLVIVQVEDISERIAARNALADRELELAAAIRAGNLAVFEYDHENNVLHGSPRLSQLYGFPPSHQMTIEDVRATYHPDDAERIEARIAADSADPNVRHFDWRLRLRMKDGSDRWVQGLGEYVRGPDGGVRRSRGVAMDVTERVKSELHQRLMIAELNHRVKNSLAVVQSLAHQSFSQDRNREEALGIFEGRLQALASANTILTDQMWEHADLQAIAEAALRPHGDAGRIRIDGPQVSIKPKFAVALSMALHELGTNAVSYGSLSSPTGLVDLSWTAGEGRIEVRWKESGGPAVAEPSRRGFGIRMIERALAADVGGKVVLEFPPSGVTCLISAPV